MAAKRQSLGKGLDALLGIPEDTEQLQDQATIEPSTANLPEQIVESLALPKDGTLRDLPVEFLQRGQYQPRRELNPEALQELANSITTQGVMQPIIVRPIGENKYEIIAGERR